jgi:DNA-binding transcriptional LysR family regulator
MEFNNSELRRLDVTLLLIFLGLMRHRKALRVAEDLGLTASAVSHALQRLRDIFGDPLFLRRPHGLEPTAVAAAIEEPVRRALEALGHALEGHGLFDPLTSERILRIAAYDLELSTLLPGLVRRLLEEAPSMRVIARATGRRDALGGLAAGEIDLALGLFDRLGGDFLSDKLFEEDFVVVMRAEAAPREGGLSLEAYLAARHLVVSPGGDLHGVVDDALMSQGLSRRVVLAAPLFLPALAAAAETGLFATLPRRLASSFAEKFGLVALEPPLNVRRFAVSAVRHRRDARSPMIDWLVGALRAASDVAAQSPGDVGL